MQTLVQTITCLVVLTLTLAAAEWCFAGYRSWVAHHGGRNLYEPSRLWIPRNWSAYSEKRGKQNSSKEVKEKGISSEII
jgi:hypothetical protein